MRVVIVGAGKVGHSLSFHLSREGCNLVVIDRSLKKLEKIVSSYDVKTIEGNACSKEVLQEAHAGQAQLFIAVTDSDEVNALSCIMAKSLGAKYTISRMRSPEFSRQTSFLTHKLGIDLMINPDQEAARFISRSLKYPAALQVESFVNSKVNLVEIELRQNCPISGLTVAEFNQKLQTDVLIVCLVRGEEIIIPKGDTILKEGDFIHITSTAKNIHTFFRAVDILDTKIKNVMIVGGGSVSYHVAKQL